MVELSLGSLFRGFNASRFILYLSLLVFTVLVSLKLDGRAHFSYAFVFLPLWICNLLVFVGATVGMCSFCAKPPSRNEILLRVDFKAMLFTAAEHVFLATFVALAFAKLEFESWFEPGYHLTWTFVFTPLYSLSIVSIGIAVWALRHDKPFEFEFLYAINIVELVFISFKLDKQVDWSWAVVFIPLWVVLSLSAVGVLYALVLSIVLARSRHFMPAHRRQHVYSAILHTFLVIPALICLVLLTGKLDAMQWSDKEPAADLPYTIVLAPLMISLFFMMLMAFGASGTQSNGTPSTNVWWFGLRQPLCPFLLDKCPPLRTYANVSYRLGISRGERQDGDREERRAVIEEANVDREEADQGERWNGERRDNRRQRAEEKARGVNGGQSGEKGAGGPSSSNQNGEQALEHGATSSSVLNAMSQYKNEYGFLWVGDIAQPD